MIEAKLTLSGFDINKPLTRYIHVDESVLAIERKDEQTNRYVRLTVGELYDIFRKNSSYVRDASDPTEHVTSEHFETWFRTKYIMGKPWEFTLLNLEFTQHKNG
jgi:hypothetical protein